MRHPILTLTLLSLLLTACATGGRQANKLIKEAEKEIAITEQMGYLWSDTENLLGEARRALSDGETERANQLAQQALDEAKMAQEQARENIDAKPVYP